MCIKEGYLRFNFTCKSGETKALEELIRRVQKQVFAMFSHLTDKRNDIADLTQETLLKMAKSLHQLKEPKTFKTWLNRIVTNVFMTMQEKNRTNLLILIWKN